MSPKVHVTLGVMGRLAADRYYTDRGLHNRGCFSKALAAHVVVQRFAGQDAPEQLWADAKEMAD